jgi:hypothetical protein
MRRRATAAARALAAQANALDRLTGRFSIACPGARRAPALRASPRNERERRETPMTAVATLWLLCLGLFLDLTDEAPTLDDE